MPREASQNRVLRDTPCRLTGVLSIAGVLLRALAAVAAAPPPAPTVFTQVPAHSDAAQPPAAAAGTLRAGWGAGARVVRWEQGSAPRVLSEGFASAADPAVAFDGERLLFAGQARPGAPWDIYEIPAGGGEPRQITRDLGDCRSPAYMSTVYTLPPPPRVDTDPWEQIMFLSTAAGAMNECGTGPATSLYSVKLDGSSPRRLTYNLSNDMDPFLMADGRILLASWRRSDLRRGTAGRIALFGLGLDGLDYAPYVLGEGRRVKHMPCATARGLVVFVETDVVPWDGAGALGAVSTRRNFHSYRPLTEPGRALYATPSPLPDGSVLVARRPADGAATHAICRFDPATGQEELLFDDPDHHDLQPVALLPRPVPSGRSTVVSERWATGRLYCLDVAISDRPELRGLRPPAVTAVRVIEGVPLAVSHAGSSYLPRDLSIGISGPGTHRGGIPPLVPRRLLGVAPLEADGSFNVEVPANTPIQLQTLDRDGIALESCAWIWARNRESRGCIGCHEDPELVPENAFVKALARESHRLLLPAERRRSVDFRRDVMPVLEARCASPQCHGRDAPPVLGAGPGLADDGGGRALFNQAYESLLAAAANGDPTPDRAVRGRYVTPGRARESRLVWHLFGRDTTLAGPGAPAPDSYALMPPAGSPPLAEDQRRAIIEWIDLGAAWSGPETAAGPQAPAPGLSEHESREEMMR